MGHLHAQSLLGIAGLVATAVLLAPVAVAQTSKARSAKLDTPPVAGWKDAFGSEPDTGVEDLAAVEPRTEADAPPMAALGELGSFPLKVHSGNSDRAYWSEDDIRTFVPQPTSRKFKLGECQFEIKTGALSARQYKQVAGAFTVMNDALAPQTTLNAAQATPAYLSVTAEIYAAVPADRQASCKTAFLNKRKRLGRLDLNTTLSLTTSEQQFPAGQVRDADGETVFLTWDEDTQSLRLEDKAGLAPSVESPVFELKPQQNGDLYIEVTPKLMVKRT